MGARVGNAVSRQIQDLELREVGEIFDAFNGIPSEIELGQIDVVVQALDVGNFTVGGFGGTLVGEGNAFGEVEQLVLVGCFFLWIVLLQTLCESDGATGWGTWWGDGHIV